MHKRFEMQSTKEKNLSSSQQMKKFSNSLVTKNYKQNNEVSIYIYRQDNNQKAAHKGRQESSCTTSWYTVNGRMVQPFQKKTTTCRLIKCALPHDQAVPVLVTEFLHICGGDKCEDSYSSVAPIKGNWRPSRWASLGRWISKYGSSGSMHF